LSRWEKLFEDLVTVTGPSLGRYAFLLTGDDAAAADLVQEGLFRAFRRARVGADIEDVEAYTRRAMLTVFLDSQRKASRWRSVQHLLADPSTDSDREQAVADRHAVREALGCLSPRQRACVVLRFYEDLTVPEIAGQLACSVGTVKRHLHEAMVRLASALGETTREETNR
jgi:RNA polymerase sigma factor (sigma-70 family)